MDDLACLRKVSRKLHLCNSAQDGTVLVPKRARGIISYYYCHGTRHTLASSYMLGGETDLYVGNNLLVDLAKYAGS